MDITVYDKLYEALGVGIEEFNAETGFTTSISKFAPDYTKSKYPLIVFSEVRNQPKTTQYSYRERISSLGYKVDIFGKTSVITLPDKTKTSLDKQQICRELMGFVVDLFQTKIGLNLISYNPFDSVGTQGELFQISLVFQKPYYENREFFI